MKLKAAFILLIILASLIPFYGLYKYLEKIIRPRQSMKRLFIYFMVILGLIFAYTFILVFIIKELFPGA